MSEEKDVRRLYICDYKKKDCKKTGCHVGWCQHTSCEKNARFKRSKRNWIHFFDPRGIVFVEYIRECDHEEFEECKFRVCESLVDDCIKYCIRERCSAMRKPIKRGRHDRE